MMEKDHYSILGLSPQASQAAIKKAYPLLVKQYHPDCVRGDKATVTEVLKKINEAYETLSDFRKRAEYDQIRWVRATQESKKKNDFAGQAKTPIEPADTVRASYSTQASGYEIIRRLTKYVFLFLWHYLGFHRILSILVALGYIYYRKIWLDSLWHGSARLFLFTVFGFLLIWFKDAIGFYEAPDYGGRFFAYVFVVIGWILLLLPLLSLCLAGSTK